MRRRILAGFLIFTLLVLGILEVPLAVTYQQRQRDRLSTDLARDAFFLASVLEEDLERGSSIGVSQIVRRYERQYDARVVVLDRSGRVLTDTDPAPRPDRTMRTRPEMAAALAGRVSTGRRRSDTLDTDLLYVAVPVASAGEVHGAVRLTITTRELDGRVRRYWLQLAGVAVIALGAVSVLGTVIARSVARPLRDVERAAHRLGGGDLMERAPITGPTEVRSLAQAFNDMAARLDELLASQESFVADASHQLRTPLTALRLRLENIEGETSGDANDDAAASLREVQRMSRIVDGLLELARADRDSVPPTAAIDLGPVVAERCADWELVATDRGVHLVAIGRDEARWVLATADRLGQVLDNLLANALDASPADGTITVSVEAHGDDVTIVVADEGPGLDADERERAFDRFWRKSTNRADRGAEELGGSGLGLAIVRKLVIADGGSVRLATAPSGGIEARVTYRAGRQS